MATIYSSNNFDSEGACFFAYTNDEQQANDLADFINGKKFLP